MTEIQIQWGIKVAAITAAIAVLVLFVLLAKGNVEEQMVLGAYRELKGFLKKRQNNSTLYQSLNCWLVKKGADFHYGEWITPVSFLGISLLLGISALVICLTFGGIAAVTAGLFCGGLPALLLVYMNKSDNEKQLPELKLIYHALEIQIKAGVYVTDALAECYGSVQEKRLKKALLAMAGDIVMKADVFESLEQMQSKFDNRYVDSLCITILQALESGQAVDLLRDIGEQIKDMEEMVLEKKKASLDRTITFCQLGVLTVVLGLALYACVSYMMGAAAFF